MSHCHTCDPIVGWVFRVQVEVNEISNVLFPVVGVLIVHWRGVQMIGCDSHFQTPLTCLAEECLFCNH